MTDELGSSPPKGSQPSAFSRPPVLFILDDQEWSARAFESVLSPHGFSVIRCRSARQLLEHIQVIAPDVFLIKHGLPDISLPELCRVLRDDIRVGATTPIIVASSTPLRGNDRLSAFAAGAWDLISVPIDAEELVLRLDVYVRSKLEADRARQLSLIDESSGFYSAQGLLRIVRELSLDATRHNSPIACVVIGPETEAKLDSQERDSDRVADRFVQLITSVGRGSDPIGRLGQTEFAVVAPRTSSSSVLRMGHRLHEAAASFSKREPADYPLRIRVGCYAVDSFQDNSIEPVELLSRAAEALRQAQRDDASPVYFFGQSYSAS